MDNPLISIVICTYNRIHLLEKTMETIFQQKYQPVEVVIVDDGSTDGTGEMIKTYGEKVQYYRQENKGIASARTLGCQLAKGKYIAFQDDDDLMCPDRILTLYVALSRYPDAVFAVGDWVYIDSEGHSTGRSRFNIKTVDNEPVLVEDGYRAVLWPLVTPLPHTTLFKKEDGERVGWFDDSRFFHTCSDTDFFARLGKLGPIVYVPEIVSYYRMGHSQLWGRKLLSEYSRVLLFEKHLNSLTDGRSDLKKRLQSRMLSTLKHIAFIQSNGVKPLELLPEHFLGRGLTQLDIKGRLSFRWYKSVKLPIKKLLFG